MGREEKKAQRRVVQTSLVLTKKAKKAVRREKKVLRRVVRRNLAKKVARREEKKARVVPKRPKENQKLRTEKPIFKWKMENHLGRHLDSLGAQRSLAELRKA